MKLSNILNNIKTKATEKLNNLKTKIEKIKGKVGQSPVVELTNEDELIDLKLDEKEKNGTEVIITPDPTPAPTVPPAPPEPTPPPMPNPIKPLDGYKYVAEIQTSDNGLTTYTLTNGVKVTVDSNQPFNEDKNVYIINGTRLYLKGLNGGQVEGTDYKDNIVIMDSVGVNVNGNGGDDVIGVTDSKFIDIDGGTGNDTIRIGNSAGINATGGSGNDIIYYDGNLPLPTECPKF